MSDREIHIELLLGARVFAINNKPVGRIEEIYGEPLGGECFIEEYLIGDYAFLERLASLNIFRQLMTIVGANRLGKKYRIKWDMLDLTDVKRPRLTCSASELKQFVETR
jgi:hypothetical protein